MTADAAFRAAVAADPDAALPRLVYADFLDDAGRPDLAAALRRDVALAAERPWRDRYWQLKSEPAGDLPDGLGRLADRVPLLCGVPDDWRSRWRAVRAFVSRWWDVPLGDIGGWGEAVDEAERVADRPLPPAVKEWAAFMAELVSHPVGEELFGEFEVIHRPEGTAWVSLVGPGDGDVLFVIGDAPADPAVTLVEDVGAGFRDLGRTADTTAEFALLVLPDYLPGKRFDGRRPADLDRARQALAAHLPHAGRFGGTEVFEGPGVLVVLRPGGPGLFPPNPSVAGWGHPKLAPRGLLTRLRAAVR